MNQNGITEAIRQVLEYLHIYERVAVRFCALLREGEEIRTLDFIVAESAMIIAEVTTSALRAIRVELHYEDEGSCRKVWRELRAFADACGRSGGGYYTFKERALTKPKRRKKAGAIGWTWINIPLLLQRLRSSTDLTGIVSRSCFGKLLSEVPGMKEHSIDQRQRFKQHLVRSGLVEEITNGSCIAGYRLPQEHNSTTETHFRPSTLEDVRIEAILKHFKDNRLDSFLAAATTATATDKLSMAAIVRLSRKHLALPQELKESFWYPVVIVKALLETGYFEKVSSSRGYLQFSALAYETVEATRDQG